MSNVRSEVRQTLDRDARTIVRLYSEELRTLREIAALYPGASKEMVKPVLVEAGVPLRSRGGQPHQRVAVPVVPVVQDVPVVGPAVGPAERGVTLELPPDGELVTLREIRDLAGFTAGQLAEIVGLHQSRTTQIERQPLADTTLGVIARHVDGCGARARLVVDFPGQETLVLFDSYYGGDGGDGGDGG